MLIKLFDEFNAKYSDSVANTKSPILEQQSGSSEAQRIMDRIY